MFLIILTKNKLSGFAEELTRKEILLGRVYGTIIFDPALIRCDLSEESFLCTQAFLPPQEAGRENLVFFRAKTKNYRLIIDKSSACLKPVYFHISASGDFFCSSHISLLRKAGVAIEENEAMLPEFFVYRHVMPPHTLYKNIQQVGLGGQLSVSYEQGRCRLDALTEYSLPEKTESRPWKEIVRHSADLLSQDMSALDKHSKDIVPLLSGGIDSSITYKICRQDFHTEESWSTEYPFEDPKLNRERRYAVSAAKALGADHHLFQPTVKDYLFGLLESIGLAEEPVHHLQSVSLHLLNRQGIPPEKTVIINGLGFGGAAGNFRNFLYWKDQPVSRIFAREFPRKALRTLSRMTGKGKHFTDCMEKLQSRHELSDPDNLLWASHAYGSKAWVRRKFNVSDQEMLEKKMKTVINRSVSLNNLYDTWALYSLLGDEAVTLSLWGKIAEGSGKTLFCPFYLPRLLDYFFSIPWSVKMSGRENRLRKDLARTLGLPAFIYNRPKSGFGIMQNQWAREDGPFEPLIPLVTPVVPLPELRAVQTSRPQDSMIFWNLINYALWKRLIIHQEPVEKLKEELQIELSKNKTMREHRSLK